MDTHSSRSLPGERLTNEQLAEVVAIRELYELAQSRLKTSIARQLRGSDLSDYSDLMREIACRENAMLARWWPTAHQVRVSTISDEPTVLIWYEAGVTSDQK